MKTKTVFRIYSDGQVIALFPQMASTIGKPWLCESYMHIGQHGEADPLITRFDKPRTRLATRQEYAPLARELRRIGYRLDTRKRCTRRDYEIRKAELQS